MIFGGVWLTTIAFVGWPLPHEFVGLLVASSLLVLLNVYDDLHGLPPLGRITVQVVLGIVAFVWGVRIEGISNFYGLFGADAWVDLGNLSGPVTVFWIVLVTNALNWLDGIDGLAAGVAGISAVALAVMATFSPALGLFPTVAVCAAALAGACAGFLRYNFSPARVFMGDTGAMFIGFMLACLSVLGAFKVPTAGAVFLPLLVLGVPLYDSTTAIAGRIMNGKSPLIGDRTHIHHRLVDRGLTVPQAALVIYGFSGILCLVALWLWWK